MTELVLFSLELLPAALVKSYRGAVRAGASLLLLFYSLYIAADCLKVPVLYYFTPLKYFDICAVTVGGIQISFLLLAAIVVISSIVVSQKIRPEMWPWTIELFTEGSLNTFRYSAMECSIYAVWTPLIFSSMSARMTV